MKLMRFVILAFVALAVFIIINSMFWRYYYASLTAVLILPFLLYLFAYYKSKASHIKYALNACYCLGILILICAISYVTPLRQYYIAEHFSYYQIPTNHIFFTGPFKMHLADKQLDKIYRKIVDDNMSDEEKEKAIYDYMILNFQYMESRNSLYDALNTGKANCVGMAMIAQELFNRAGIKSYLVNGLGNGKPHTWNMVKIGEHYYHLDFTMLASDQFRVKDGNKYSVHPDAYLLLNMNDEIADIAHDWIYKNYPSCKTNYIKIMIGENYE